MPIILSPQRKDPGSWDTCTLDGHALAGQSNVTVTRSRKVEEKKVPGTNGEDLDIKGIESAELSIETKTWTDEQYEANVKIFETLDPPPGKEKAKIIPIDHATVRSRRIGFVILTKIEGPKQDGHYTTWKITARERLKPNSNNVGLGPPAGQTCDQMRQEYAFKRDDYLQAKSRAQLVIADLRNQQAEASGVFGNDDSRVLLIEQKIRQIEDEVHRKLLYLRAVGDRMIQKGCPNVPPDAGNL